MGCEQLVTCGLELLQTFPHDFDPSLGVAKTDGQLPFEAMSDRKGGPERVGFGARDKPIDVLFGAREIAGPKEYRSGPVQNNGKRYGMVHAFGAYYGLTRAIHGLGRMALQP